MISDRYIPDADDYDLAQPRGPSPPRSSRDDGKQHRKHGAHKSSRHGEKSRHREASVEDVEDGEIVEPDAGGADASQPAAADRRSQDGLTTAADPAANGEHRYPADDPSLDKPAAKGR